MRRPGRRRSERRIKAACFPRQKELRTFDYGANPNITPETLSTLATCEWVRKGQPLCLIGDSGTGKSHLLIALGTEAAMAGYRVRYVLAAKLVNELVEAADDKQLTKTIARYGRVDLLCIDELGYMELDRRGAELLFQVLTEREEKNSMAIASNESFSKAHMFTRTCVRRRRRCIGSGPTVDQFTVNPPWSAVSRSQSIQFRHRASSSSSARSGWGAAS
jgi:DNA replication protein DnaC